jgi:hypothetical protein
MKKVQIEELQFKTYDSDPEKKLLQVRLCPQKGQFQNEAETFQLVLVGWFGCSELHLEFLNGLHSINKLQLFSLHLSKSWPACFVFLTGSGPVYLNAH